MTGSRAWRPCRIELFPLLFCRREPKEFIRIICAHVPSKHVEVAAQAANVPDTLLIWEALWTVTQALQHNKREVSQRAKKLDSTLPVARALQRIPSPHQRLGRKGEA